MRVHVILKKEVLDSPAKEAALARVLKAGKITLDNRQRFERHGIITGEAEPALLSRVRDLDEVESVETDQERFVTRD